MADDDEVHDKRRRRRNSTETGSESEPGDANTSVNDVENTSAYVETPDSTVLDTSGNVTEDTEADNSEYESAEEDQDEVTGTEGSEEETETVDEQTYDETTDDDIDSRLDESICSEIVEEERQSGDGQEQPDELKDDLDDDEDAKNPAYIPRRGAFYEHDNRAGEEEKTDADTRPKRPLWKEEGRWLHDLFKTELQAPKSREELIALYGYDIRTKDKPPDEPPRFMRRGRGRRGGLDSRQQLRDFIPPADVRDIKPSRGGGGGGRGGSSPRGGGRGGKISGQHDFQVKEEEFPRLPGSPVRPAETRPAPKAVTKTPDLRSPPKPQPQAEPRNSNYQRKQFTNSNYKMQSQQHNEHRGQYESDLPPPQSQVPPKERRSNRSARGRNSAERTLPERMSGMTITNSNNGSGMTGEPPMRERDDRAPPAKEPVQPAPQPHQPSLQGAGDASVMLRSQKDAQSRPKRYSTQRQRPVQDQPQQYPADQVQSFYPPGFSSAPMYQPSSRDVTYSTTVYNGQAVPYSVPTGASGLASPPRIFPQPNVSMAPMPPTGPPPGLIATPYPAAGVPGAVPAGVYAGPGPFQPMVGQIPPGMAMGAAMPVSAANNQQQQQQNLQEMYHGGTTYYPPHPHAGPQSNQQWQQQQQQQQHRSKKAIPIVHPQDVPIRYEVDHRDDDRERTPTNE